MAWNWTIRSQFVASNYRSNVCSPKLSRLFEASVKYESETRAT